MTKWIKCSEKLPELDEFDYASKNVIAHWENNVCPLKYQKTIVRGKKIERWEFVWGGICNFKVTHWMPLPKPPQQSEG